MLGCSYTVAILSGIYVRAFHHLARLLRFLLIAEFCASSYFHRKYFKQSLVLLVVWIAQLEGHVS
jgi:hypothetical protein